MRKFSPYALVFFVTSLCVTMGIAYTVGTFFETWVIGIVVFLILNLIVFRYAQSKVPSDIVDYTMDDASSRYDIVCLYGIFFIYPIITLRLIPPPLSKIVYTLIGTTLGKNSYPAYTLIHMPFSYVTVGDDVIFGESASVTPHSVESDGKITLKPISIGNNVTICMHSVILPGVIIEDDATIAAGAVVTKNTHVKKGEVWAGIPARKIRDGAPSVQT